MLYAIFDFSAKCNLGKLAKNVRTGGTLRAFQPPLVQHHNSIAKNIHLNNLISHRRNKGYTIALITTTKKCMGYDTQAIRKLHSINNEHAKASTTSRTRPKLQRAQK